MALATRELELIILAKDRTQATMARVAGGLVILGGAITALGVRGARELGNMTSEALEFRQAMALAVTQADGLGANIQNVGDIVNRIGTNLPVPFEELSDALFDIFSTFTSDQLSSLDQAETILRAFGEAAVAGQAPIRDIGRSVIAWINALDQPATLENVTKILDVQFELVRKGAGTYEEFAGVIGKAIPAFVGAGQTVETFGGSLAFLTKNGLSASMAATSAARAVELMFTPKAIKGLRGVGIEVENGAGEFRQMNDIIRDLIPVFDNLSDAQRKIKFKEIFGTGRIQARRFFDLAIPNIAEFDELIQDMELSSGEAAKAFELLFGQPLSQMQLFQNRVESIRREFGDQFIKTLEERVFPVLERLWQWWLDLSPATKELIIRLSALSVAIAILGGALLLTTGFFLLFITLLKSFSGATAIAGLGKLAVSLGLIGVVLAAIAGVGFLIFKNWDKISPFLIDVWDRVTEAARDFRDTNDEFFDTILEKAGTIWEKMLTLGVAIWERAKSFWAAIWEEILLLWDRFGKDILRSVSGAWDAVQEIFLSSMDIIIGILDFFIALFDGDWSALWQAVQDIASSALKVLVGIWEFWSEIISQAWRIFWDLLKEAASDIWNAIFEFLSGVWESIASTASDIWQGILDFFIGIWESITSTAKDTLEGKGGLLEFFQMLPGRIIDAIFGVLVLLIELGGKMIGAILEGVIGFAPTLFLWFLALPGRITGAIPGVVRLLFNIGWTILRGLWNGINLLWRNVLWPWFRNLPRLIFITIPGMVNTVNGIGRTLMRGFWIGIIWMWNNLLVPWFKGVGNAIVRGIGNVRNALFNAGSSIISGFLRGMKSAWNGVRKWVLGKISWITSTWRNALKLFSPSKVFIEIGRDTMRGLEIGLVKGFKPIDLAMSGFINKQLTPNLMQTGTGISGLASTTTTSTDDHSQIFQFGDIISQADAADIAAEMAWLTRMG